MRGSSGETFPIKLFYTSNMPIILLSALVGNLYFLSSLLYKRYGAAVPILGLLGRWTEDANGRTVPTGGLAYYISPPRNLSDLVADPFHSLFYITFMLTACALFAKTWMEISGSGPKDVAASLRAQHVTMRNDKDMVTTLSRYIPTAAAFGGVCVGALSIGADLLGAIGSGTGILMAVTTIYDLYEKTRKELALAGGLKGLMGQQ
jgi:protein transport protein SEC61 subunit alpha